MVTTKPITTSDSQFTMGHNRSLESSMNRKKTQKIEKKHILENFQFQHISIFWEYIDDVFSFDAFSENKIYSWRERTLLNCLYTVNMRVYVLYFNLENTCKYILQYTCICSAPRAQGDSKILWTFFYKIKFLNKNDDYMLFTSWVKY